MPRCSVELSFRTRQLRTLCEDNERAISVFGRTIGTNLRRRLADLRAAQAIDDIIVGKPTIGGHQSSELRLSLGDGYSLLCRPNHQMTDLTAGDLFDWSHVYRLQIMKIEKVS